MTFVFTPKSLLFDDQNAQNIYKAFPINAICQFKAYGCGDFVWVTAIRKIAVTFEAELKNYEALINFAYKELLKHFQ